jgi:hypothetical protein
MNKKGVRVWLLISQALLMTCRTHGYSPQGQGCHGAHDWGAKGRTNVIGAAFYAGVLITLSLFLASIDTVAFTSWIIQNLLSRLPAKSVLLLDNASFHKGK